MNTEKSSVTRLIELMVSTADHTRDMHDALDLAELSREELEEVSRIAREARAYWDALASAAERVMAGEEMQGA